MKTFFSSLRILLVALLTVCTALPVAAYEQRNLLTGTNPKGDKGLQLLPPAKWVPFPAYTDRSGWDSLTGELKEDFIKTGERWLDYKWSFVPPMAYMEFRRTGNRNVMQHPYSQNATALKELLLAELAEGKGRFIGQLINGVWQSCEMTSWAYSAHLGVQKSHSPLPDYFEEIIDLGSGERAALLSWIYYFMHEEFDKVTPQISQRMEYELNRRIVRPYLQRNYWWNGLGVKPGSRSLNNWNPWCNYNVLLTYLIMEQHQPDTLNAGVWRTMESVDEFLNYIKGDGACEEGPSYWSHAAGKLFDYLELLSDAMGGKTSYFDSPLIKSMGEYIARSYVGDGWVVNFADASAHDTGSPLLIYRYGRAVKSTVMKQYAAYLMDRQAQSPERDYRAVSSKDLSQCLRSLLWLKDLRQEEPRLTTERSTWYPETEFCYMNSKEGLFLACKGGHNDESHNHNDVGTFSLYADHIPLFIDAGVGTYTRQTFSSERYSIWTMQSDYHNLPRINGVSEKNGKKYKARNTHFDKSRMTFTADIAGAFPETAGAKRWNRSYRLNGRNVKITDDFELNQAIAPNEVNFMTWEKPILLKPGLISVSAKGHKGTLQYDAAIFDASVEVLKQTDRALQRVWGDELHRIRLKAKQPVLKGHYTFDIKIPR